MAAHVRMPSSVRAKVDRMNRYLSTKGDNTEKIPIGLYEDLRDVLMFLEGYFDSVSNYSERDYFVHLRHSRLSEDLTIGETKDIARRIHSLSYPMVQERSYTEGRLERKIDALGQELARLRSDPALGKEIAKLEKELRKLRVASVTSSKGNEKEQKDMLKNYKEADKKVFIIMPFAPAFDDVWKGGIERACDAEEFGHMRVDKISLSSWITEDIVNYVNMADFVIADITGNRPNVMFELGWALAKDKKPIVIRQQDDPNQVPFDVKDIRYIPYANSWSGIERLYRDICKFLKTTLETVSEESTKGKGKKRKSKKT